MKRTDLKKFPTEKFIRLLVGVAPTRSAFLVALRTLAMHGDIPGVPYVTRVHALIAGQRVPAAYIDLGYDETIEDNAVVIPFSVDADGDVLGAWGCEPIMRGAL